MEWYGWLMAAFMGWAVLVTVASVGKPRKPITGGGAVAVLVVQALFIFGILKLGGAL